MKRLIVIWMLLIPSFTYADFPINNYRVKIVKLEVWPSNNGPGRYSAWVENGIPTSLTGCPSDGGFTIEDGPGAEAAYSTILAAALADKEVELYLTRCQNFVVADRVRLIP